MRRAIQRKIEQVRKDRDDLERLILDELDSYFRAYRFSKAVFSTYGDIFYDRDGSIIDVHVEQTLDQYALWRNINDLLDAYFTFVHNGGLEAIWTPEGGWQ